MSAILDEPAVRRAAFPVSVEFYHELGRLGMVDQSVELLDGVIVSKMSKSPLHAATLDRLDDLIRAALRPGLRLRHESPITADGSEPEPDLAVVEGSLRDLATHHPKTALLVVEVAVSSVEIDRRKAVIYARAGIPEYWLVEPEARRITVFRQPSTAGYGTERVFSADDLLTSEALPALSLKVGELFD
jgi:Uma2 family endonuclease